MNAERFDELLGKYLDDCLTAQEADELARLVASSKELREQFRQQVEMAEALSLIADGRRSTEQFSEVLDARLDAESQKFEFLEGVLDRTERTRAWGLVRRLSPWLGAALAACLVAAFGLGAWTAWRSKPSDGARAVAEEPREAMHEGVAVISRAVDVAWGGPESFLAGDSVASNQILHVESGIVGIQFLRGATVTLRGPAQLEIRDTDNAVLREGEAWASVPVPARGFTLHTPQAEIVDLGTEFGVSVGRDGETAVRVLKGLVELYEPGTGRAATSCRKLTAGQGLAIDAQKNSRPLAVDPGKPSFAMRQEEEKRKARRQRFERWLAWSEERQADPRVVLYYRFDREPDAETTIHNLGTAGSSSDGTIVGCSWSRGRWAQKPALDFKRPSDRVRFHLPGKFTSITLAAWVRVDGLDRRFNSLMLTDGWDRGEIHWQFNDGGGLGLSISGRVGNDRKTKSPNDWYTKSLVDLSRLGQWIHVASVYDGEEKAIRHYFNGRRVGRADVLEFSGPVSIGTAELGNWGRPEEYVCPIRNFNGRMDEFIVFNTALSDAEVLAMRDAGNPYK